jgi:Zn-dependent protease
MNLLLAVISLLALLPVVHFVANPPDWLVNLLWGSVEINLVLAVFNLWPIPPLDGSKVLAGVLPPALARPYEGLSRYGMLIVLLIFIVLPYAGLNVFEWMVGRPVEAIERPILRLLGAPA